MYSNWELRTVGHTILDSRTKVLNRGETDASHLLTNDALQTEAEARGKWWGVQLTAVQLTSYFSGFSDILEMREQRKQALGDKFNYTEGAPPMIVAPKATLNDAANGYANATLTVATTNGAAGDLLGIQPGLGVGLGANGAVRFAASAGATAVQVGTVPGGAGAPADPG